jgi:hypothetical protein
MKFDCVICYCESEGSSFTCADPSCTAKVCGDCIQRYVEFAFKEHVLPSCPSTRCKSHFLYRDIKRLSKEVAKMYEDSCVTYLEIHLNEEIVKTDKARMFVNEHRKERAAFFQTIPVAVHELITIALSSKMKKIESAQKKRQLQMTNDSFKRCCHILCDGLLNNHFECGKCGTSFCSECEQEKKDGHACRQEDIDSVRFVNSLVQCPQCKLRVIRSYGCNFITCSHCKTNFDYTNGRRTLAGNHHDADLTLRDSTNVSHVIGQYYTNDDTTMELLVKLEEKEPVVHPLSVKHYQRLRDTPAQLAGAYDRHLVSKFKTRTYAACLVYIQKLHNEKTLTNDVLEQLLKKL